MFPFGITSKISAIPQIQCDADAVQNIRILIFAAPHLGYRRLADPGKALRYFVPIIARQYSVNNKRATRTHSFLSVFIGSSQFIDRCFLRRSRRQAAMAFFLGLTLSGYSVPAPEMQNSHKQEAAHLCLWLFSG